MIPVGSWTTRSKCPGPNFGGGLVCSKSNFEAGLGAEADKQKANVLCWPPGALHRNSIEMRGLGPAPFGTGWVGGSLPLQLLMARRKVLAWHDEVYGDNPGVLFFCCDSGLPPCPPVHFRLEQIPHGFVSRPSWTSKKTNVSLTMFNRKGHEERNGGGKVDSSNVL